MPNDDLRRVIEQLSSEHSDLLPRLADLVDLALAGDPALGSAVDALADHFRAPLEAHIALEDDVIFPAYARATGDRGLVDQFWEEHREILALRDQLLALRQALHGGTALVNAVVRLGDLLTSHMTREEQMLFPSARELGLALSR